MAVELINHPASDETLAEVKTALEMGNTTRSGVNTAETDANTLRGSKNTALENLAAELDKINELAKTAGLMSQTDKDKLDKIEAGAQKNTVTGIKGSAETKYRTGEVNLTKANIGLDKVENTADADKEVKNADTADKLTTARTLTIGSKGKTFDGSADVSYTLDEIGASAKDHTHDVATESAAGFMSAADKKKLDGIDAGATQEAYTYGVDENGMWSLYKYNA